MAPDRAVRSALAAALISCAAGTYRSKARRFVEGLSADELEFIAGFLGARLLDASAGGATRAQWAEQIARYERESADADPSRSADREHKLLVLLEYLSRTGVAVLPKRVS